MSTKVLFQNTPKVNEINGINLEFLQVLHGDFSFNISVNKVKTKKLNSLTQMNLIVNDQASL